MNLEDRKRVEHRCRALRRVGSVLVCMALLLATAFPPPPARAVAVVDDAAIATIIAAYLSSCGMTFRGSGMSSNGVKEQLGQVIDGYLQEEQFGKTPLEWLGEFYVDFIRGQICLPGLIANKLSDLARWVEEKFSVDAGVDAEPAIVYQFSGISVKLANGNDFFLGDGTAGTIGTVFMISEFPIEFENGSKVMMHSKAVSLYFGSSYHDFWMNPFSDSLFSFSIFGTDVWAMTLLNGELIKLSTCFGSVANVFGNVSSENEELIIVPSEVISIPEPIADDQALVISAPAITAAPTLDDALQAILDAIAAGQLDTTQTITKPGEVVEPGEEVEPVEEAFPVVAELGLPALGAALTSRFPFSIPWDVARAIKLLAAPAKAPYFEVDFMAPIAYRFGGFPGSTKIVLDFSEYEIIGQLTRWTSTIGFCLLLASGTKKLTWTA